MSAEALLKQPFFAETSRPTRKDPFIYLSYLAKIREAQQALRDSCQEFSKWNHQIKTDLNECHQNVTEIKEELSLLNRDTGQDGIPNETRGLSSSE